ncbi:hypothetical protein BH20ACI3_BH20ACI3_21080 [soil metagenome]
MELTILRARLTPDGANKVKRSLVTINIQLLTELPNLSTICTDLSLVIPITHHSSLITRYSSLPLITEYLLNYAREIQNRRATIASERRPVHHRERSWLQGGEPAQSAVGVGRVRHVIS